MAGIAGRHRVVRRCLTSTMIAGLSAACVTAAEREQPVKPEIAHAYIADKPASLHNHFYVTLAQGDRNRVLNDMRLGLATLQMGRYDLAETMFDDALQRIEAVYADNAKAKQARELFVKETTKDFKGEPYERAMSYFYRGLLYLRAGDYDNARASFKGGALQDAFAEDDQFRADLASMPFLQGWASKCANNPGTAREDFKEFRDINATAPLPADADNVLVLIETGGAPFKFSATDPNQSKPRYLKFARGPSGARAVRIRAAGLEATVAAPSQRLGVAAFVLEDIYRQASTRGGREFDSILAGKAMFKDTAGTVGDVALVGAGVAAAYAAGRNDRDAAIAAGALLLVAVLAKAAAEAAEPAADTRFWDNLPDRVHAATLRLPESVAAVDVDFMVPGLGTVLDTRRADIWRAGPCGVAWVRDGRADAIAPRAPNSAPGETMAMPVVIPPLPTTAVAGQTAPAAATPPADSSPFGGLGRLFGVPPAAAAEPAAPAQPEPGPNDNSNGVDE